MNEEPLIENETAPEPPQIRLLRRLVLALLVVLIGGVVTVVGLLVIRLTENPSPPSPVIGMISVPIDHKAGAFTRGDGWSALVTTAPDGQQYILVYDEAGSLLQQVEITR